MTPIETVQALVDALSQMVAAGSDRGRPPSRHCYTTSGLGRAFEQAVDVLPAGRALLAQMQAGNGLADQLRSDEEDSAPVVQVVEQLRALIADDAWACTFQTFGQYRSALLKAIDRMKEPRE